MFFSTVFLTKTIYTPHSLLILGVCFVLGYIKNLVGFGEETLDTRGRFLNLTADFERTVSTDFPSKGSASKTVDMAKKIREVLGDKELALVREEKLKLLKMINKAKVRALMSNEDFAFELFSSLDSISTDISKRI